jgi:hypothetical protein
MSAAAKARDEADRWSFVLSLAELLASGWDRPDPTEAAVAGFDPEADLERRARAWSHRVDTPTLPALLEFGAALCIAEAEAWEAGDRVTATKALEDRRFLLGDRVLHWAVPWLVTVGSTQADWAPEAMAAVESLLELGDTHRVAPALAELEGLVPPGHDSLGPLPEGLVTEYVGGGWLFQDPQTQVGSEPYEAAAALWEQMAEGHPGSERLWRDLAARARRSAELLTRQSE